MKKAIISRNERYNRLVTNLLAELKAYDDAALNRKPSGGGWSAIQTAHHLMLSEELSLAYVKKKLSFNPELEKTGLGARVRGFFLWLYLSAPIKFKAPPNVGDDKLPDRASFADTSARWQKIRGEWTDFFENMPEELADKAVYRHPRAARLGWHQMLSFFETHFARHSKQIRRALNEQ